MAFLLGSPPSEPEPMGFIDLLTPVDTGTITQNIYDQLAGNTGTISQNIYDQLGPLGSHSTKVQSHNISLINYRYRAHGMPVRHRYNCNR
jgi:hypothetical protein